MHSIFFLFFCSNLLYELATEVAYLKQWHYAETYAAWTLLWIFFAFWIVWDALNPFKDRPKLLAIPTVIAIGVARLGYSEMGGHLTRGEWVVLLEGAALLFLAQVLGAAATYSKWLYNAYLALSFTWLGLFLFLYGFILHDSWLGLKWVPAIIVGSGFLITGIALGSSGRYVISSPTTSAR